MVNYSAIELPEHLVDWRTICYASVAPGWVHATNTAFTQLLLIHTVPLTSVDL